MSVRWPQAPAPPGWRPPTRPTVTHDPPGRFTVEIPFPDGQTAYVDVMYDVGMDTYAVQMTGGVIDQSPEAVTVGLQLAIRAIHEYRTGRD